MSVSGKAKNKDSILINLFLCQCIIIKLTTIFITIKIPIKVLNVVKIGLYREYLLKIGN